MKHLLYAIGKYHKNCRNRISKRFCQPYSCGEKVNTAFPLSTLLDYEISFFASIGTWEGQHLLEGERVCQVLWNAWKKRQHRQKHIFQKVAHLRYDCVAWKLAAGCNHSLTSCGDFLLSTVNTCVLSPLRALSSCLKIRYSCDPNPLLLEYAFNLTKGLRWICFVSKNINPLKQYCLTFGNMTLIMHPIEC